MRTEVRCCVDRVEINDCVEVSSEGHVVCHGAQSGHLYGCIEFGYETRDVLDGDGSGAGALGLDGCDDESGGGVQTNHGLRFGHLDHARFHKNRRHPDSSVTTHGQAAGYLDVDDTPVGIRAGGRLHDRAAHCCVSVGLEHQPRAQVVGLLNDVSTSLFHSRSREHADPADDDPRGHALGM